MTPLLNVSRKTSEAGEETGVFDPVLAVMHENFRLTEFLAYRMLGRGKPKSFASTSEADPEAIDDRAPATIEPDPGLGLYAAEPRNCPLRQLDDELTEAQAFIVRETERLQYLEHIHRKHAELWIGLYRDEIDRVRLTMTGRNDYPIDLVEVRRLITDYQVVILFVSEVTAEQAFSNLLNLLMTFEEGETSTSSLLKASALHLLGTIQLRLSPLFFFRITSVYLIIPS